MIDKAVYIIGAGFSAPLGLPLMGNFLEKSKDLFTERSDEYQYFEDVFKQISRMSAIKNYYSADLFNVEELLSILEMESFLEGDSLSEDFKSFLADVVHAYTPEISKPRNKSLPGNWQDFIFGNDAQTRIYGAFVASMFNLEVTHQDNGFSAAVCDSRKCEYAVITLNYDDILEQCVSFITQEFHHGPDLRFDTAADRESDACRPILAKLHGSVGDGVIVPPTWSKGVDTRISDTWKLAFNALSSANHIRFLGYSLPVSDSYVQYLLKAAILNTDHLKSIDAVCLDSDGSVEERYRNLFTYKKFRFRSADIFSYLKEIHRTTKESRRSRGRDQPLQANQLEAVHDQFMRAHASE